MSKDKIAWSEIFKKNTYYEQKDKMQNIFSIRCIIIVFLLYSFTFFLNLIGVFIVDTQIFVISYVEMIVALLIYLALLTSIGLEKPVTKYLNITVIAVMVTISGSALTYHTVIIVVIPIIFSSMYADKKLASYAFVITILSIIITTYAGYYNGVCDANMALLTTKKLSDISKDGVFLMNEVNKNPLASLGLYYVVPRSLLATCFYAVCKNVYHIVEKMMENAIRVKTLAAMDDMTGMYNRNKLLEVVNSDTYKDMQVAIIYWDVNRLKYVNDTFGHLSGDFLIVKIAESIKQVCGEQAETFRYGGDEFIMIIKNGTADLAEEIIAKWKKVVVEIDDTSEFPISASVGYAVGQGKDMRTIIGKADKKMYANKGQRRE